jgi:hypothetical protein
MRAVCARRWWHVPGCPSAAVDPADASCAVGTLGVLLGAATRTWPCLSKPRNRLYSAFTPHASTTNARAQTLKGKPRCSAPRHA